MNTLRYILLAVLFFTILGWIFGRCILLDTLYPTRVECIRGEFHAFFSRNVTTFTDTVENDVNDSVDHPHEKRIEAMTGTMERLNF